VLARRWSSCWFDGVAYDERGARLAQGGRTVQKWEYLFVNIRANGRVEGPSGTGQYTVESTVPGYAGTFDQMTIPHLFNHFGNEGWELVKCNGDEYGFSGTSPLPFIQAVFKRFKA
jgi:hypothetical protein